MLQWKVCKLIFSLCFLLSNYIYDDFNYQNATSGLLNKHKMLNVLFLSSSQLQLTAA